MSRLDVVDVVSVNTIETLERFVSKYFEVKSICIVWSNGHKQVRIF